MAEDHADIVPVLCTGQLVKFDMAVNALKEAGIPYQTRGETATGLKFPVSVAAAPGPGRFFTLLVPAAAQSEAKLVLSRLPFDVTATPGVWDFGPRPMVKRAWKTILVAVLAFLLAYGIMGALGLVK